MQRIVVAQRSEEKGIVVNFVGTTMQRGALQSKGEKSRWVFFVVYIF